MSEPKIDEKKVVGRNVAIALGIVCIVLTAALFGTIAIFYVENTNLQDQVNNLNAIINHEKIVSEVLLNNKTYSLSPNENVSEWFYTPHSGDLKVECNMEPRNLNIWVNASWSVYFSPSGL
jgi:wobble nucleotide-excising tRNase